MLLGTHDALIRQVQRVDIHGTHFYDLVITHADTPDQPRRVRVGVESIYADPQPNDPIRISYLMGVATGIERRTA